MILRGSFFGVQFIEPQSGSAALAKEREGDRAASPPAGIVDEFCGSFRAATGLPLMWNRPGEFRLPEDAGIPDFCRVMSAGRKACATCVKTHVGLQDAEGFEVKTAKCFAGLTSSAVPVVREGRTVGYLHTGHVYVDRSPGCSAPGRGCMLPGGRKPGCGCAGACQKTRQVTAEQYAGALGLLQYFARQVADLREPGPAPLHSSIAQAVRMIRNDVAHDWRLPELASAVGMHPGYFSEQFHRQTGTTFTKFVARLRVDKARQLLGYTASPVSEIAFATGFRSISQFNRVFKSETGRTPGEVRGVSAPTSRVRTG